MKNNKKGFTIVELIATVIILAIVISLAIVSITAVSKRARQKQYDNLMIYIKAKAEGYFNDTGVNKAFVQTLIENGYIDADDESKNIYSPIDNKSLNCYLITKSEVNTIIEENDDCDYDLLSSSAISITYCLGSGCTPTERLNKNEWFNSENITLGVVKNDVSDPLDLNNAYYSWINPLVPDTPGHEKTYLVTVNNNSFLNDRFDLILNSNGSSYTTSSPLKVDRIKPTVILSLSSKETSYNTRTITYTITGSDAHSGPAQACLSTTNSSDGCTWQELSNKKYIGEYTLPGAEASGETYTLYAFIKDAAGNISNADSKSYKIYKSCELSQNIDYRDGNTCSKRCRKGSYNRIAYDEYTGERCPAFDKDSGGSACNDFSCCDIGYVVYEDGVSCSNTCGAGTYNRKAYDAVRYSEGSRSRCPDYDYESGGEYCYNTAGCPDDDDCGYDDYDLECINGYYYEVWYNTCDDDWEYDRTSRTCGSSSGTWEEDSCSSDGWVIEKNTSTGATRTTSKSCRTYLSCSYTSCYTAIGRKYVQCTYKEGGRSGTETMTDYYISCDNYTDGIYAYRCLEEQALLINKCQPQYYSNGELNPNAMCKTSDDTEVTRQLLSDTYYSNGNTCKVTTTTDSHYCTNAYKLNPTVYTAAEMPGSYGSSIKCDMSYLVKNGTVSAYDWTHDRNINGWVQNGKYYCDSVYYWDKIDKATGKRLQELGCSNWRYCNCFWRDWCSDICSCTSVC